MKKQATPADRRALRQGDVMLVPVNTPKGGLDEWTSVPKDPDGAVVLARGEETGHRHAFYAGNVTALSALDAPEMPEYLVVQDAPAELRHEEHNTIVVPPGVYRVAKPREFTNRGARDIRD